MRYIRFSVIQLMVNLCQFLRFIVHPLSFPAGLNRQREQYLVQSPSSEKRVSPPGSQTFSCSSARVGNPSIRELCCSDQPPVNTVLVWQSVVYIHQQPNQQVFLVIIVIMIFFNSFRVPPSFSGRKLIQGSYVGRESIAKSIAVVSGKKDQSSYLERCPDCA